MSTSAGYQGASDRAIRHHYDAGNAFYALWLDASLTYSCALWEAGDSDQALERAQCRKIDYHIAQARAAGQDYVLDIGCGWGALLLRLVNGHGVKSAVGLTLSAAQADMLAHLNDPRIEVREENWFDHVPRRPYDAILSVAAFEAFVKPGMPEEAKVQAYRTLFQRCHDWLRPGGWMSLQTIAWGNTTPEASSQFIEREIFPESDLPTRAELTRAVESLFDVVVLRNDRADYERTARVWLQRLRAVRAQAVEVVGTATVDRYITYLKLACIAFHTGKLNLYRVTLRRIDQPSR